jgi:hypothetical protein
MAKVITSEVVSEATSESVKVKCTAGSPYGADGQEIELLQSEVENAKAKGFIK